MLQPPDGWPGDRALPAGGGEADNPGPRPAPGPVAPLRSQVSGALTQPQEEKNNIHIKGTVGER